MRIGHGYDVHKLIKDRDLIVGGVKIPYEKGLLGHSDADVLLHAIADSLLGAVAFGDIGGMFPDTDVAYKNADSLLLLKKVVEKLSDNGYYVVNIDSTIIAQEPKMKPYIEDMRKNISETLNVSLCDINVKATTEEKLGFTGNGDGIAAHAVCLVDKK